MKRLLLLGGGHAHLRVLVELAKRPRPDREVVLVTPDPRQVYSGMLPGWVAGHYALDQCTIDLRALARAAGVRLLLDAAAGLDLPNRLVRTCEQQALPFDVLSIDVGSAPPPHLPHLQHLPELQAGMAVQAVPVRPLPRFVAAWEPLVQRVRASCRPFDVAVLGAGPGGVELALALSHRALREGWSHLRVHLVGSDASPLPAAPRAAQARVLEWLRQRCVRWHGEARAIALRADHVELAGGASVPADACWLATGAAAPAWLADSGLAVDAQGFVRVGATLQSVSHPQVFAAGDAASHASPLPKSGVYAVRAGPVLAHNLLSACDGGRLREWKPQARALYLVSAGDRRALAIWGDTAWQGAWVWRWKDRIDRRFIRAHARGEPGSR